MTTAIRVYALGALLLASVGFAFADFAPHWQTVSDALTWRQPLACASATRHRGALQRCGMDDAGYRAQPDRHRVHRRDLDRNRRNVTTAMNTRARTSSRRLTDVAGDG
ncbi:MAG: hypothetical protein ABI294_04090 [Casimicrobiaceae bacterium]